MNLKIKRMRELAGFFAQTVRTDGFGPTLKRSAAFLKRRFGSKKGRFLPKGNAGGPARAGLRRAGLACGEHLRTSVQYAAEIPAPAAGQRVGPDLPELAALPGRRQRRGPR